jgi:hypothetical protein
MDFQTISDFRFNTCSTKSVLGRERNCVGEQALLCEMVASSYMCQPNQSYADFHSRDHTRGCAVASVLYSLSELSNRGTALQYYS